MWIFSLEEADNSIDLLTTDIVPGGHGFQTGGYDMIKKQPAFDLPVADHAGVWRFASSIAVDEIVKDKIVEAVLEVNYAEFDAQTAGNRFNLCGLFSKARLTDVHQKAVHLIMFFQQQSAGGRVDPAAHGQADLFN